MNPTPNTTPCITSRLTAHLAGDGTANDNTTDELYREAHGIGPDAETDLDEVERWAYAVVNPSLASAPAVTPQNSSVPLFTGWRGDQNAADLRLTAHAECRLRGDLIFGDIIRANTPGTPFLWTVSVVRAMRHSPNSERLCGHAPTASAAKRIVETLLFDTGTCRGQPATTDPSLCDFPTYVRCEVAGILGMDPNDSRIRPMLQGLEANSRLMEQLGNEQRARNTTG